MTLIELPRRPRAPRAFVEVPAGLERKVARALDALGNLPDDLELPGRDAFAAALVELADALEGDSDLEPDVDDEPEPEDEALPLFAFAGLPARPP